MTLSILKYKHSLLLCGGLLSLTTNINAEAISSDNRAYFEISSISRGNTVPVSSVVKAPKSMSDDKPASGSVAPGSNSAASVPASVPDLEQKIENVKTSPKNEPQRQPVPHVAARPAQILNDDISSYYPHLIRLAGIKAPEDVVLEDIGIFFPNDQGKQGLALAHFRSLCNEPQVGASVVAPSRRLDAVPPVHNVGARGVQPQVEFFEDRDVAPSRGGRQPQVVFVDSSRRGERLAAAPQAQNVGAVQLDGKRKGTEFTDAERGRASVLLQDANKGPADKYKSRAMRSLEGEFSKKRAEALYYDIINNVPDSDED